MLEQYVPYIIFALGALAVLIVLTLAFRTVAGSVKGRRGSRLGISEYHEVDKQRRLVLIRRDATEHLILIGGNQDVVIESGIPVPSLATEEVPAMERLRPSDRLDAEEEAEEPELVRREPELTRQEPEPVRQEPSVVRPMPLRAAPRPAVFGNGTAAQDQTRTEPRLQAVAPMKGQNEA